MDKKQEAIELLKKETTDLANLYKKDGGFVLSGTYNNEKEETYNKEQWEPKDGEFVTNTFDCGRTISIFCKHFLPDTPYLNPTILVYCGLSTDKILYFNDIFGVVKMTKSTPAEIKQLTDALAKEGKRWNADKKRIEDISKPKTYEEYLRAFEINNKAFDDYWKFSNEFKENLKIIQERPNFSTITSGTTLSHMAELCDKPTVDERKILNQMIKLCKQLLNGKK